MPSLSVTSKKIPPQNKQANNRAHVSVDTEPPVIVFHNLPFYRVKESFFLSTPFHAAQEASTKSSSQRQDSFSPVESIKFCLCWHALAIHNRFRYEIFTYAHIIYNAF